MVFRVLQLFLFFLLIIFLALLDYSFFPALPKPLDGISLTLMTSFFVVLVFQQRFALWIFVLSFALSVLFGRSGMVITLPIGVATIWLLNYLITTVFTNRSLWVLLTLGLAGSIFFTVITSLVKFIALHLFEGLTYTFLSWPSQVMAILAMLISFTAAFFCTKALSRRFASYFIVTASAE